MSQATARLTDGCRLVATRLADAIRLTLEGEEIGLLSLRSTWRLTEGLDRLATAPATTRRRSAAPQSTASKSPRSYRSRTADSESEG